MLWVVCFLLWIVRSEAVVGVDNYQVIDIDLMYYDPLVNSSRAYRYLDILTEGHAIINVGNISDNVGFFVLQVHSYMEEASLSYSNIISLNNHVNGTNIGLVQIHRVEESFHQFYLSTQSKQLPVLFVATVYTKESPVPGGCNMVFNTEIAPYQKVYWQNEMIQVDAQAPSAPNIICELSQVKLQFYHMYLRERDSSKEAYFQGLEKMLTVDDVRKNGLEVTGTFLRRYYSAYAGTGVVVTIVATYGNYSSVYVPAVSYGCDVFNWQESCSGPTTILWKLICASLLFLGAFVCFLGHGFFRTTLFLAGFAFGTFLTHIILFGLYSLSASQALTCACIFGVMYGAFWMLLWWKFGIPVFSIYLSFVLSGMLISGIMFYSVLGDFNIFHNDLCYWLTVSCVCFTYSIILTGVARFGHIFVCAFLGSYALISALSIYVGANLHYIIINLYRRATIQNFNLAVVDPPYQDRDINLTVSWILFLISGVCLQYWLNKGRPPFPPHRNPRNDDEMQPLLIGNRRLFYADA